MHYTERGFYLSSLNINNIYSLIFSSGNQNIAFLCGNKTFYFVSMDIKDDSQRFIHLAQIIEYNFSIITGSVESSSIFA